MADRSLGRTAKNLFLALLNATLILLALCLWLAWNVLSTAERVSEQMAVAAGTVTPLREGIEALTAEIAGARADVADLRVGLEASETGSADQVAERLAGIEAEMARLRGALQDLSIDPDPLIDRAMTAAFAELRGLTADLVEVVRPDSEPAPDPAPGG
ncbi:hypothetical protein [Histidinibacterium lentulum]|uniref:Uncharacterized protein n=1 Tax=Histidinibacterium lentulum TaxID=2480588 RepID=A0A3N2R7I4_9RHOB|nr:hypothetical protein [Histidinibacterium lentulum]ROU03331.1 hypothetical protein EAT49_03215 [Histidinibacterium lentulum]